MAKVRMGYNSEDQTVYKLSGDRLSSWTAVWREHRAGRFHRITYTPRYDDIQRTINYHYITGVQWFYRCAEFWS